ncbi:MAG: hypothetical protein JST84_26120 [Acidobacteria bacterium]|nr:hypothetical protein [Acidobacteriota bacterium]
MEPATFEQVVAMVSSLPTHDRERFKEWFKQQERLDTKTNGSPAIESSTQPMPSTLEEREARFQRALRWLEENKAKYLGQWVALDGDRLLAAGTDGKQVYAEAVAAGVEVPFLKRVIEEPEPYYAGW